MVNLYFDKFDEDGNYISNGLTLEEHAFVKDSRTWNDLDIFIDILEVINEPIEFNQRNSLYLMEAFIVSDMITRCCWEDLSCMIDLPEDVTPVFLYITGPTRPNTRNTRNISELVPDDAVLLSGSNSIDFFKYIVLRSNYAHASFSIQPRQRYFLCLNNKERSHRRHIYEHLVKNDLMRLGNVSFHFEGIILDDIDEGEIFFCNHPTDTTEIYGNSYFSIVTETTNTNDEIFLTEKTYKAILNCHPFLLVGQAGSLKHLRNLGYKTFDPWIDESYDAIENKNERLAAITAEIDRICSMTKDDIHEWYCSMEQVLTHNQRRMKTDHTSLIDLLNQLKYI